MSRRNLPDRKPVVNQDFPLVLNRLIAEPGSRPGAVKRRIQQEVVGQSRYIGGADGKAIAFVWLDDEAAVKGEAANDPQM